MTGRAPTRFGGGVGVVDPVCPEHSNDLCMVGLGRTEYNRKPRSLFLEPNRLSSCKVPEFLFGLRVEITRSLPGLIPVKKPLDRLKESLSRDPSLVHPMLGM